MDKPIEVAQNSLPTTVITILRYLLTAFGAYLVSHNVLPAGTDVNQIVGAVIVVAATAYGAFKSFQHNEQKKVMEPYAPNSVAKPKT